MRQAGGKKNCWHIIFFPCLFIFLMKRKKKLSVAELPPWNSFLGCVRNQPQRHLFAPRRICSTEQREHSGAATEFVSSAKAKRRGRVLTTQVGSIQGWLFVYSYVEILSQWTWWKSRVIMCLFFTVLLPHEIIFFKVHHPQESSLLLRHWCWEVWQVLPD